MYSHPDHLALLVRMHQREFEREANQARLWRAARLQPDERYRRRRRRR